MISKGIKIKIVRVNDCLAQDKLPDKGENKIIAKIK